MNYETGNLGFPTTREIPTRRPGSLNRFEGGNVYYKQNATAAYNVQGQILQKWGGLDYEVGTLGFPASNEAVIKNNGRFNSFDGGSIYRSGATGARTVWGETGRYWGENNWENGPFGYPTSDEYNFNGLVRQNYQGGNITFTPVTIPINAEDAVPGTPSIPGTDARAQSSDPALQEPTADAESSEIAPTSGLEEPAIEEPAIDAESNEPAAAPVMPPTEGRLPPRPEEIKAGSEPMSPSEMQARLLGGFCVFGTYGGPGGACRGGATLDVMFCVGALVAAVAGTYFAAGKILKLKRMFNDHGGARYVATQFRALNTAEKKEFADITLELGGLLATELFSLDLVAERC